ncbi:MAG: T9SS type A sorting domain-containing protein [Bacteroidia bacterium]|nr:T9SS type A sorting domain-containing protein [Bacteroidia bacterium]
MIRSIVFSIVFVVLCFVLSATHNRAGEILYKRIAPFTSGVGTNTIQVFTYSITVVKYTDHGPIIADRCVDTVYFGDGNKGIAPRINGAYGCCGMLNGDSIGCGEIIINTPGYVVKKNVYSIIHTYGGPGNFLIRSRDPNRNAGIINILNSDYFPFCISSLIIINPFADAGSSPEFSFPPLDQGSVNACFSHNPGAYDSDGDSLSYDITPCECAVGYSDPSTGNGGSFGINHVTGLIDWCTPQQIGEYSIAIMVTQWRKNTAGVHQSMGYVTRDMQILVNSVYTGLDENKLNEIIQIFPNPTQNEVRIVSQNVDVIDMNIYNITGQLVFAKKTDSKKDNTINLTNLQKGIYTLELNTSEGTVVKKLVKD